MSLPFFILCCPVNLFYPMLLLMALRYFCRKRMPTYDSGILLFQNMTLLLCVCAVFDLLAAGILWLAAPEYFPSWHYLAGTVLVDAAAGVAGYRIFRKKILSELELVRPQSRKRLFWIMCAFSFFMILLYAVSSAAYCFSVHSYSVDTREELRHCRSPHEQAFTWVPADAREIHYTGGLNLFTWNCRLTPENLKKYESDRKIEFQQDQSTKEPLFPFFQEMFAEDFRGRTPDNTILSFRSTEEKNGGGIYLLYDSTVGKLYGYYMTM